MLQPVVQVEDWEEAAVQNEIAGEGQGRPSKDRQQQRQPSRYLRRKARGSHNGSDALKTDSVPGRLHCPASDQLPETLQAVVHFFGRIVMNQPCPHDAAALFQSKPLGDGQGIEVAIPDVNTPSRQRLGHLTG